MKYYYTDPLKAAWMSEKFGVRFLVDAPEKEWLSMTAVYASDYNKDVDGAISGIIHAFSGRIYVHTDDYGVFEPKDGDMCDYTWDQACLRSRAYKEDYRTNCLAVVGHYEVVKFKEKAGYYLNEIIKRNGTAFFMPEVEQ